MSEALQNTTVVADGLALMPGHRAGKTNLDAILSIYLGQIQEIEDVAWQMLVERWVSTAVGAQLDQLGRLVGEPRRLFSADDDNYRRLIRARVAANQSDGTVNQCLIILRLVFDTDVGPLVLRQLFPAAMQVTAVDVAVADVLSTIAASFFRAGALGGVRTQLITNIVAPAIAFTFVAVEATLPAGAGITAGDTEIDIDETGIDMPSAGTLVLNPGSFTQEVLTYTDYDGASIFSGLTNEIGGSGLRFDHADGELVVDEQDQAKGFTGTRALVTWENIVTATATGNNLQKTAATAAWDSGASSVESFDGDGEVSFTTNDPNDMVAVGLGEANADATLGDIEYAMNANSNVSIRIYEGGSLAYTHPSYVFTPGDVGRVLRLGTEITYWFNGENIYTSGVTDPNNTLYCDCSIYGQNDIIVNALLRDYDSPAGGTLATSKDGE